MTQRRIYQNEYPYFVTTNTQKGEWVFDDISMADILSSVIFNAARMKGFIVVSYQIMPNHLHLLVVNKNLVAHLPAQPSAVAMDSSKQNAIAGAEACAWGNITQLMHSIKSFYHTEIKTKFRITHSIWQKRFYARTVTCEEQLRNTIKYIKNNPVKEGLPKKYLNAPYYHINTTATQSLFLVSG